jgi:hypothetical protein
MDFASCKFISFNIVLGHYQVLGEAITFQKVFKSQGD